MAYIQLTRGFITLVDDDLLEELNSYLWYASGEDGRPARRRIEDRRIILIYHQILDVLPWELKAAGKCVDHINNDPLDNRKCNLRVVTIRENNLNRFGGRRGISYDSTHGKYKVYIDRDNMPRLNVGTFKFRMDAERALSIARKELGIENN